MYKTFNQKHRLPTHCDCTRLIISLMLKVTSDTMKQISAEVHTISVMVTKSSIVIIHQHESIISSS